MDLTFDLAKPIEAHGEQLSQLVLREPTVDEIKSIGIPFSTDGGQIRLDAALCARWIVKLAGVPSTSVSALKVSDFNAICWGILGFFV